jgi:hypothetical protein
VQWFVVVLMFISSSTCSGIRQEKEQDDGQQVQAKNYHSYHYHQMRIVNCKQGRPAVLETAGQ